MTVEAPYAEPVGGELFNSMAFFDGEGRRMGVFGKIHLAGGIEPKTDETVNLLEKRYFRPGNLGFQTFDGGVARIGGLIC
ncbi:MULTISPECIES: nitrilase-related carbon-nitrogen hydrolase [unclassified Bradyrhizobium]|uniref:nitrilase-related carbon-nitrogen hydrolase n=1 Tax=unclassified Bradyrhizobium TaxID=2631580 RepID=UPI001CD6CF53|nr:MULTISPECIES: nitrilase-related carbon-nitrogen hydrolase [unclassified Bradyrhizobium]MCA1378943.1 hypothetical protein [Bradyrhizobium sp. IC4060]MCA1489020.1 hypothetical protein [Bradyrhizobium sp. IC4061]